MIKSFLGALSCYVIKTQNWNLSKFSSEVYNLKSRVAPREKWVFPLWSFTQRWHVTRPVQIHPLSHHTDVNWRHLHLRRFFIFFEVRGSSFITSYVYFFTLFIFYFFHPQGSKAHELVPYTHFLPSLQRFNVSYECNISLIAFLLKQLKHTI